MFQSSRIASGNCFLQASSACSPSSASTISKSSPSSIRRATLRMTLESSTTRQVFIAASRRLGSAEVVRPSVQFHSNSCRRSLVGEAKHAVDVNQHQQLVLQAVNADRQLGEPRIEVDGIGLAQTVVELEHLTDAVDQQPV